MTFIGDITIKAPKAAPPIVTNSERWISEPTFPPAMLKPTSTAPRTIKPPTMTITRDHRLRVHGPSATSIVIEAIARFLPKMVGKNPDSAG